MFHCYLIFIICFKKSPIRLISSLKALDFSPLWLLKIFFLCVRFQNFLKNSTWGLLNSFKLLLYIWHPAAVLLPGKSHGWRSLVGCSLWGREESDKTQRLHFHFSLSCIGERNGNPLQCSCLENPRDGWAAIYGVAQSWTQLKQLSSSSSSQYLC